jgi:hypothetical protein
VNTIHVQRQQIYRKGGGPGQLLLVRTVINYERFISTVYAQRRRLAIMMGKILYTGINELHTNRANQQGKAGRGAVIILFSYSSWQFNQRAISSSTSTGFAHRKK